MIFITIFLTGARDLPEFNSVDWIIFSIMCILEIPTIIAFFTFAIKSGKGNLEFEKQIYEVKRSVLESAPLLWGPGDLTSVLTNYECSHRITVYYNCIENENLSVCYNMEMLDENYNLRFLYQSKIFTNENAAPIIEVMFSDLLDITDRFIKNT